MLKVYIDNVLAEENWHMPIESFQYLIIFLRVNTAFSFNTLLFHLKHFTHCNRDSDLESRKTLTWKLATLQPVIRHTFLNNTISCT